MEQGRKEARVRSGARNRSPEGPTQAVVQDRPSLAYFRAPDEEVLGCRLAAPAEGAGAARAIPGRHSGAEVPPKL
eukprot:4343001-Alexandrium_andersonii.AAC.1